MWVHRIICISFVKKVLELKEFWILILEFYVFPQILIVREMEMPLFSKIERHRDTLYFQSDLTRRIERWLIRRIWEGMESHRFLKLYGYQAIGVQVPPKFVPYWTLILTGLIQSINNLNSATVLSFVLLDVAFFSFTYYQSIIFFALDGRSETIVTRRKTKDRTARLWN